MNIPYLWCSEL